MGLLEAGLVRQSKSGHLASLDPCPDVLAEVFLQCAEAHRETDYIILLYRPQVTYRLAKIVLTYVANSYIVHYVI